MFSSFLGGLFGSTAKPQTQPQPQAQPLPQMNYSIFSKKAEKEKFYEQERNLSACEMNDDDLDGDLNLSDSDDGEQKRANFKAARRQKKSKAAKVHVVEADTNIFQVSLACLKNAGVMATGDPFLC